MFSGNAVDFQISNAPNFSYIKLAQIRAQIIAFLSCSRSSFIIAKKSICALKLINNNFRIIFDPQIYNLIFNKRNWLRVIRTTRRRCLRKMITFYLCVRASSPLNYCIAQMGRRRRCEVSTRKARRRPLMQCLATHQQTMQQTTPHHAPHAAESVLLYRQKGENVTKCIFRRFSGNYRNNKRETCVCIFSEGLMCAMRWGGKVE